MFKISSDVDTKCDICCLSYLIYCGYYSSMSFTGVRFCSVCVRGEACAATLPSSNTASCFYHDHILELQENIISVTLSNAPENPDSHALFSLNSMRFVPLAAIPKRGQRISITCVSLQLWEHGTCSMSDIRVYPMIDDFIQLNTFF